MKTKTILTGLAFALASTGFSANAAQDITFKLAATTDGVTHSVPMPDSGQAAHTFEVVLDYEYQSNGGRCIMLYNESSCTIKNMTPAVTLANIHWGRAFMTKSIQQVSSWINIDYKETESTILIPSSNVHFYFLGNAAPSADLVVYGRSSLQVSNHGRASMQTTENANNLGSKIANLQTYTKQNGIKFPMLAGCMNLAVHNTHSTNITRVHFPQINSSTGPMTSTLCVPGNDTTTFVGIDTTTERVASISTKVPSELTHLYK